MKIKQHIPATVSGIKSAVVSFNTLNELFQISFVKKFKNLPGFDRFSLSDNLLMAELNNKTWWVVGKIEAPFELDLPKWAPKIENNSGQN